jgi:DNA invertase Pin-like site-specific DNA recombinase
MIHPLLKPHHLQRTAYVYLRQSSPGQVRRNREGQQRQQAMVEHVATLGWPRPQIILLDGDTGKTGSSQHGRTAFQMLLEAIVTAKAGLVAARELSRLVRDNQDWAHLVRLCRFKDVLLADERRLYDAADAQDRMVLGIQGAFNEFELSMILDRMQESLRQKARRGEQYDGLPPGYICRQAALCEKHPDPRVQRAIEKVLKDFERFPSVRQLYLHLDAEAFQLPVLHNGADWRDVEWVRPSYEQILSLVRHPAYAGIYVRGRRKSFVTLDERGAQADQTPPRPAGRMGCVSGTSPRSIYPAGNVGTKYGKNCRQRHDPRRPHQRAGRSRRKPDGGAVALPPLRLSPSNRTTRPVACATSVTVGSDSGNAAAAAV